MCRDMKWPRDFHTEGSKSEREKQILHNITYMCNLEKGYSWTYLKNRNRSRDIEEKINGYQGGRRSGLNWQAGVDTDTKYKITNENQLYSPGNSTQCFVVT